MILAIYRHKKTLKNLPKLLFFIPLIAIYVTDDFSRLS